MIYDSELAGTATACPNDADCGYIGDLEEFVDFMIDCEDIKYDQPFFIRCKCPECETSFVSKLEARTTFDISEDVEIYHPEKVHIIGA